MVEEANSYDNDMELVAGSAFQPGRRASNGWKLISNVECPQRREELMCIHCRCNVKVFKRISLVRNHLNHCSKFAQFMAMHGEPPSWYKPMVYKMWSKVAAKDGKVAVNKKKQTSMKQYAVPVLGTAASSFLPLEFLSSASSIHCSRKPWIFSAQASTSRHGRL
jgi:hypothetical protein